MLTNLTIRNFKRFHEVEIDLGQAVVLIGRNKCGKTTALQALDVWHLGAKPWNGRQTNKRGGVTINRRDLTSVPAPDSNLLWRHEGRNSHASSRGFV